MNNTLIAILVVSVVLFLSFLAILLLVLTQTILILKRLLLKLEIHVDGFSKDKEEIKLKILSLAEEFFMKLKSFIPYQNQKGGDLDAKKEKKDK